MHPWTIPKRKHFVKKKKWQVPHGEDKKVYIYWNLDSSKRYLKANKVKREVFPSVLL